MSDLATPPALGHNGGPPLPPEPAPEAPKPDPRAWVNFQLKRLPDLREEILPYNFQDFAVYKSLLQMRFVFGLATGLGKSFCAFQCWKIFRTKYPTCRLIVLTNKSAILQFKGEYSKFYATEVNAIAVTDRMPKLGERTYADSRKKAYRYFGSANHGVAYELMVMGYATYRIDIEYIEEHIFKPLSAAGVPVFVVADEATVFKNISTATSRAIRRAAVYSLKLVCLTATLTKGKLEEIYGIFKGMGIAQVIAENKDAFLDRYCVTFELPGRKYQRQISGYKNIGEFLEKIRPYVVVLRKADVAEFLPAYVVKKSWVEHSDAQNELIAGIYSGVVDVRQFSRDATDLTGEAEAETETQSEGVLTLQRITETGYIKRALLDPRLVYKTNLTDFSKESYSPKTAELIRFLTEECTDEKVVVYTPSKVYLKLLLGSIRRATALERHYQNPFEISGDVSATLREEYKEAFQTGTERRLIVINDAGLESINLQSASILCVTGMPRTGGDLIQLAGRLSRLGSAHNSLLINYILTENSQDADEYAIIQRQMQIAALVQGEAEKGLLDTELLRELDQVAAEVSDEDYQSNSMSKLLFFKRKKRASAYNKHAQAG